MHKFYFIALASVLSFSMLCAATQEADAQVFAGAQVRGGLGDYNEDGDTDMSFGFGLRGYAGYDLPMVGVGVNFDYGWYTTSKGGFDTTLSMPSAGLLVRVDPLPIVKFNVLANYIFGTFEMSGGSDELSVAGSQSIGGLLLGLEALYSIRIPPFKTYIEVGPYFHYHWVKGDDAPDNAEYVDFWAAGLAVQGHFQIGL
jgi:hypothetical protein